MFEIPNAKRVKRSKLFLSGASSSSSTSSIASAGDDENSGDGKSSLQSTTASSKRKKGQILSETLRQATPDSIDSGPAIEDAPIGYGFEYDFVDVVREPPIANVDLKLGNDSGSTLENDNPDQDQSANGPREQTFEFYLFKPETQPEQSHPQTETEIDKEILSSVQNRITIRSPTPESARTPGQGSILHPRPHSHYFTSFHPEDVKNELRTQYENMAISGSEIELLSAKSWPGTHLPWRVIRLNVPSVKNQAKDNTTAVTKNITSTEILDLNPNQSQIQDLKRDDAISSTNSQNIPLKTTSLIGCDSHHHRLRRRRPSKKRRILIRQRHAFRLSQQAAAKVAAQVAEEAEREKRTRRNREKKVKRKQREKRKKAGEGEKADEEKEIDDDGPVECRATS